MVVQSVLIVDDDPSIVALLRTALEEEGYRVETASGDDALQIAREVRPSLILLDILMPGMGGAELSRRLRADPATSRIPILAMSAVAQFPVFTDEMAIDDVLPKPFRLADLLAKIARWVRPI